MRFPVSRRSAMPRRARARDRSRVSLEPLEPRAMLATLVSDVLGGTRDTILTGVVYEDLNANGTREAGEDGVVGWTVYLDLDNSGTWNTDANGDAEPSSVTDQDGTFLLRNLMPGVYRLAEAVPDGWTPTSPVFSEVTVTLDQETQHDFFNFGGGSIVGTLWSDLDGDGTRTADVAGSWIDPGLAAWTVFVDLNTNGVPDPAEPLTTTDADGRYSFTGLAAGDYEVTEILPDGWDVTRGHDTKRTVTVVALTESTRDFGNLSLVNGGIAGVIWNDTNADGVRATDPDTGAFTESGLAGWTVFLDLDKDGQLDVAGDGTPLEPTTVTDAAGQYWFTSLIAGDYEVTEVLAAGFDVAPGFDVVQTVTVAGGRTSVAGDFANFTTLNGGIRGIVWNDLNRNGLRDATAIGGFLDPGLSGWTVFVDLDHNGLPDAGEPTALTDADGGYAFADLQVGTYEVREVIPAGWETATGFSDSMAVRVSSGVESVAPDFAVVDVSAVVPASVSGTVWSDTDGNGVRAGGEAGIVGWTVFADANGNGSLDGTEASTVTAADGSYTITGVTPGTVSIVAAAAGWRPTAPTSRVRVVAPKNGDALGGIDFGFAPLRDAAIAGQVFLDANANGQRDAGERGLAGVTVYLDLNDDGVRDATEPSLLTSSDLFYTPDVDETGDWSFATLAAGAYTVRVEVPAAYSVTPLSESVHAIDLGAGVAQVGVTTGLVARPTELHGIVYDDRNGDGVHDVGEDGRGDVTVYVDLDRDGIHDADEPVSTTAPDGRYTFAGLPTGAYVIREDVASDRVSSGPATTGGTLWPGGTSNPAVGDVSPTSLTLVLAEGESSRHTVSLTLPNGGAVTDLVDVFLLFDDTGSFVNNSPIVRAAFPEIMSQLQAALPSVDLAFGVGRFEEYANFASEYETGRPFVLNQPIVAASTPGATAAVQAALDRTTPGYGGDGPETDIEALYQLVTGAGFDGNGNGSSLDSGPAGLVSTQLTPGASGDVPSFASFQLDTAGGMLAPAGLIGGAGFRAGALPVVLTATDIGFAYQPKGETSVTGANGVTLPLSSLTGTSRGTTPRGAGAGIQETVTALNALGALVIGLGTNSQPTSAPRQSLEALSMLTGAINRTTSTIANGTPDAIAPGDPLYFQISSGFSSSVSTGVVNAILNAATSVAVDITVKASDPRVQIVNHSGTAVAIGSGQTATFDIEFIGDGVPRRFDLQFVREGSDVVLGSIPVVIGTPIPGDCYDFTELEDGEITEGHDFGSHIASDVIVNVADGESQTDTRGYANDETIVKWGKGTLILNQSNTHTGGLRVEEGEVVIRQAMALNTGPLVVGAGGKVTIDVGTAVIDAASLTLDATGVIDVVDGGFRLAPGSYDAAAIRAALISGGNGGSWTGTSGIVSSVAGQGLGVGYVVAADGTLTARSTANGDAQLDGTVDFDDILALFPNYGAAGSFTWQQGDFTYDGKVDFDDILALFPNYGGVGVFGAGTSGGLGVAGGGSGAATVMGPQPPSGLQQPTQLLERPGPLVQGESDLGSLKATSLAFAAIATELDATNGLSIGTKKRPLGEGQP